MQQNKLMELTPDKMGLLVYLSDHNTVDLSTIKCFMRDIAESGLTLAEDNLPVAEKLLKTGLSNRTVIHKSLFDGNYPPPTTKFIINKIIFPITMVVNKIFRLMDGEYNVPTYSR